MYMYSLFVMLVGSPGMKACPVVPLSCCLVDTAALMLDPQTMINMINNQGRQTKAAMSHKDSLCDLCTSENGEGRSGRLFDLWMVSSVYKQRVASFPWFDGYNMQLAVTTIATGVHVHVDVNLNSELTNKDKE